MAGVEVEGAWFGASCLCGLLYFLPHLAACLISQDLSLPCMSVDLGVRKKGLFHVFCSIPRLPLFIDKSATLFLIGFSTAVSLSLFCPLQWKLDLHGLHISEAIAAVEKRLTELANIDLGAVHQLAPPQNINQATGTYNNTRSNMAHQQQQQRQNVLHPAGQSMRNGNASWVKQRLSVVVGRGVHSSEGEASLPRSVEAWLLDHGYRFKSGFGSIEVSL